VVRERERPPGAVVDRPLALEVSEVKAPALVQRQALAQSGCGLGRAGEGGHARQQDDAERSGATVDEGGHERATVARASARGPGTDLATPFGRLDDTRSDRCLPPATRRR